MEDEKGELVPEIRFKGFTDNWIQRKLGEVVEFNPRSILPDSFEYVDLESVVGTSLISHRTENKNTAPSRAQRLAKRGDVFFQTVRPYQKNNYLYDLSFDNYVFSTGYAQLRPKIDSYFLLCKLQEENFVTKVLDHCTGTSYPAINSTDLAEIDVYIVFKKSEQTAIGNFFRTLDDTISLYKCKLDGLKELKNGYLQQMFPQSDECVPRLRFEGFTEPWERKELGSITDVRDGTHNSPKYFTKGHPFITSKNIKDGKINFDDVQFISTDDFNEINKRSKVDENDILMGMIGTIGNIALVSAPPDFAIKNVALIKNIEKVNCLFLFSILQSPSVSKFLGDGMDGGTQKFIALNKIRTLLISIPEPEEQTAIGNFFHTLDEQIVTQQTKLNKLKQLKVAYLQKMFV